MFLLRIVPYVLVGSFAGFLYRSATQIEFHHRGSTLGPDFWPRLLLGLLIAACLYEIGRIVLFRGRRGGASGVLQDLVEESGATRGGARTASRSFPLAACCTTRWRPARRSTRRSPTCASSSRSTSI